MAKDDLQVIDAMIVYNGKVAAFFERSRTMLSAMLEAELEAYVAELHRSPETLLVVPETNAVEGKLPVGLEEAVYAFIQRRRAIFAFVKSTAAGVMLTGYLRAATGEGAARGRTGRKRRVRGGPSLC